MSEKGGRPRYPWNIEATVEELSDILGVPPDSLPDLVPDTEGGEVDGTRALLASFRIYLKLFLLARPHLEALEKMQAVIVAMSSEVKALSERYGQAIEVYEPVRRFFKAAGPLLRERRPDLVEVIGGGAVADRIVHLGAELPLRIRELVTELDRELEAFRPVLTEEARPLERFERTLREAFLVAMATERIQLPEIVRILDRDGCRADVGAATMRIRKELSRLRQRFPRVFERSYSELLLDELENGDGTGARVSEWVRRAMLAGAGDLPSDDEGEPGEGNGRGIEPEPVG